MVDLFENVVNVLAVNNETGSKLVDFKGNNSAVVVERVSFTCLN